LRKLSRILSLPTEFLFLGDSGLGERFFWIYLGEGRMVEKSFLFFGNSMV
jgi:hypothetical protein